MNYNDFNQKYIFSSEPLNEFIDINKIAEIQNFYETNHYLKSDDLSMFLNWVIYNSRLYCVDDAEKIKISSYKGNCANTQQINDLILKKIGFETFKFNIGGVFNQKPIHSINYLKVPVMIDNKIITKEFILDPTFRQFCTYEENRFERYFEEPRYNVNKSTPFPGYFFNLTEKGKKFANDLIKTGYFELSDENTKLYFDCFNLYLKDKNQYDNINLLGKIATTDLSASTYRMLMKENRDNYENGNFGLYTKTPKARVITNNKNFLYNIKKMLQKIGNDKNDFTQDKIK